jgi:hypothetical protein
VQRLVAIVLALLATASLPRAADDPHAGHEYMGQEHAEPPPGGWSTMVHGYAFLVANRQEGPSGDRDFESVNHLSVAATHALWGGTGSVLGSFSLEPVTVPRQGSPLLFQRGETYNGVLLVDRQHPHDLFLELAVAWQRRLSRVASFRAYLAPEGEPPVGPTSYPHRLSASAIPTAPLSHHNLDSTHLSANVISTAFGFGPVTVEAGVFHGAEPDENRFDLDGGPIDSYAGRISVRPIEGLALQISAARRTHPEALEDGNQTRQTASVEYERTLPGGVVAATLALGRNLLPGDLVETGSLLEGLWTFKTHHTVTARAEIVDRDVYELIHKTARPDTVPPQNTSVDAFTVGYLHDLPWLADLQPVVGITATAYRFDSILNDAYGSGPLSGQIFLRLTFGNHGGAGMHHHH